MEHSLDRAELIDSAHLLLLCSAPFFAPASGPAHFKATMTVVNVDQIREKGLELHEPVSAELLDSALNAEGRDTGFRAVSGATLDVKLTKVSRGVIVNGRLDFTVKAPCKRCIGEVVRTFPTAFTLNLVPESLLKREQDEGEAEDDHAGESGGSFDLDKAEEDTFNGKTIDLDPIVREQVLLAIPMSVVCGEDCKGLCPMCGQNRNEEQCACEPTAVDPRLAVLKNIKLS